APRAAATHNLAVGVCNLGMRFGPTPGDGPTPTFAEYGAVALDARTGRERWRRPLDGSADVRLGADRVYVTSTPGWTETTLHVLDPATGEPLREIPLPVGARFVDAEPGGRDVVVLTGQ